MEYACVVSSSVACLAVLQFFPHYLVNGTIIEKKKVTELKILFLFSLQILSETFLILTRTERDVVINVHRSSRKVSVVIVILMKTEFSRQIFEK